jgi:Na+(H+)/acetate symporter ActP
MSAASFISMAGIISFNGIRRVCLFNGLDRRLCIVSAIISALLKKIWKIHSSRFYWRSLLFKCC